MRSRKELAVLAAALGGLPVLGCLPGSPTERAGVRYGDVLLAIDGKPTATWDDFIEARNACGARFTARIFRDGVELDFDIELATTAPRAPLELLRQIAAAEPDEPDERSN
jgi:S1-C subfamily serine protease